jgi:hypothetical protein
VSLTERDLRESDAILHRRLFGPRPGGLDLFASLAVVVVAIGIVLATGVVKTDSGAFAVVLSAPVLLLTLVPAPALQLGLAFGRRRAWPAQDAYLWAGLVAADGNPSSAERELLPAMHAALLAADTGDDCLAPLATARSKAGKLPAGYRRRILATRYRGVLFAILGGVWILVAIVIGMAVAGGVVWL